MADTRGMPTRRTATTPDDPPRPKPATKGPTITSRPSRPNRLGRLGGRGGPSRPDRPSLTKVALVVLALLGVVVLSTVAVAAAVSTRPVVYTASTQVLYGEGQVDAILQDDTTTGDPDRTLATQAQVVVSDAVTADAGKSLGMKPTDLVDATKVTTLPQSDVMVISVEAPDAGQAAHRATVLTAQYLSVAKKQAKAGLSSQSEALEPQIQLLRQAVLYSQTHNRPGNAAANQVALSGLLQQQAQLIAAAQSAQGRATLLAAATVPDAPSSLSTKTGAVAGFAVGLVLATGLLLVAVWWRRPPAVPED